MISALLRSAVFRTVCCVCFIGFCFAALAPREAHAQARTWHYNSDNFTQPGSLPWYSGTPWRPLQGLFGAPTAVVTPTYAPVQSPCGGCVTPGPTASCAPTGYGSCATTACSSTCAPTGAMALQQTVGYVPQTVYRTVYRQVPVTSYLPVSSCDPCGQAVTAYRPVTTYVPQAQRVAMTTYRAVPTIAYKPVIACTSGCATVCGASPCAGGACGGATAGYYSPAGSSSCSSCTPTYTPSSPSLSSGGTGSTGVTPSLQGQPPASDAGGSTGVPRTFSTERPVDETPLFGPINGEVPVDMGREVDPSEIHSGDQSTLRFLAPRDQVTLVHHPGAVRTAVFTRSVEISQAERDAAGWRSTPSQ